MGNVTSSIRNSRNIPSIELLTYVQRMGIKGRGMAVVWHEKASRTALQTNLLSHTHLLLVQTHNMTTKCRTMSSSLFFYILWVLYFSTYAYPLYSTSDIRQTRYTKHPTYYLLNPEQHTKQLFRSAQFLIVILFCVRFFIPFKYSR